MLRDSVRNCLGYVTKKTPKKEYLKGFSLITLTKDDEIFSYSVHMAWSSLWEEEGGSVCLERKDIVILLCM